MAKVNIQYIRQDIFRAASRFKNLARGASLSRFNKLKNNLIEDFLHHPITKEIEAGPASEGSSGVVSRGNLFSFIGFDEGSDPITPLVNLLEKNVQLGASPSIESRGDILIFSYDVVFPTKEEIAEASPMPWQKGRSWANDMEEGISGVGNYLFHRYFPREKSRSTSGLQSRGKGMGATFTPRSYITEIVNKFKQQI